MTYEILGIHEVSETIQAKDRVEAYQKFKELHPDYRPGYIGDDMIVGICEDSGRPIFLDDDYQEDEYGVMWLKDSQPLQP